MRTDSDLLVLLVVALGIPCSLVPFSFWSERSLGVSERAWECHPYWRLPVRFKS